MPRSTRKVTAFSFNEEEVAAMEDAFPHWRTKKGEQQTEVEEDLADSVLIRLGRDDDDLLFLFIAKVKVFHYT